MANDEHLAVLMRGAEIWNAWRRANFHVTPDLAGATLKHAILAHAQLFGAKLAGADLTNARLTFAHLGGADLDHADLSGADLARADLTMADLTHANLTDADLMYAQLTHANLTGTNLSQVALRDTVFANIDLSQAKGLDSCYHHGPSIIDYRTLQQSGQLPVNFLRGCGLPDGLIDYLPSLLNQPIQFYSCFISYSSKDEAFAECLHADLQNRGIRCWFAPHDLAIGARFRGSIDVAIRERDKLLVILSGNAIDSDWVEDEVETALEEERKNRRTILFPIRIDDAVIETTRAWARKLRRERHIGDFSSWKDHDAYQKGLKRLLHDLKINPEKD